MSTTRAAVKVAARRLRRVPILGVLLDLLAGVVAEVEAESTGTAPARAQPPPVEPAPPDE